MKIALAYGRGHLDVEFPDDRTTIIEPSHQPGLADERAAMIAALDAPVGASPLRTQVAGKKVVIVHTDITRATPNDRLIPWPLAYLEGAGARREDITLLNGLGTHRPNTQAEMEQMITPAVVANYRCINHEPENDDAHVQFGVTRTGAPALINRHLAEADVRIITGFIEPHFFAEFLGKLGLSDLVPIQLDEARWPELAGAFARAFAAEDRDHWAALFDGSDACVAPVLTAAEAPAHPHHVARQTWVKHEGLVQPAPAPRFSRTPGTLRQTGEGEALLAQWGVVV